MNELVREIGEEGARGEGGRGGGQEKDRLECGSTTVKRRFSPLGVSVCN